MKTLKLIFSLFFLFAFLTASAGAPLAMQNNGSSSLAPMLKKILPGVVNIAVRGELPMMKIPVLDQQKRQREVNIAPKFEDLGSGVIVDAEHGFIITNAHVIKDARSITVTLNDGRQMRARTVGYDAPSDIAVLQIPAKRLSAASFGNSDQLQVGDFVCAIGTPFGLQQTVTSGVVSGLERSNLGIEGYENFIQTDAPINPGNSGGALVNMKGDLVGINTAIITPSQTGGNVGVGLAIPSNMVRSVMEQLVKYGKVERGVLGVMVQNVTPALAQAMKLGVKEGALVSQVVPGSPAFVAGIKPRDVIVNIMGNSVHSAAQISNTIGLLRVGSKVNLQVERNGQLVSLSGDIVPPEKLKDALMGKTTLLSGVALRNFNQLLGGNLIQGVEVIGIDDASIAYSNGIRLGDVIINANNQPVRDINELKNMAKENDKNLLLEVRRGEGGDIFLVLEQ
jgi:serine protease Do